MKAYIVVKTSGCHSGVTTKGICFHRPKVGGKIVLVDLEGKVVLKSGVLASAEKGTEKGSWVCKTKHGSTYSVKKLNLHPAK